MATSWLGPSNSANNGTPRPIDELVSFNAPGSLEADQYRTLRHVVERLSQQRPDAGEDFGGRLGLRVDQHVARQGDEGRIPPPGQGFGPWGQHLRRQRPLR